MFIRLILAIILLSFPLIINANSELKLPLQNNPDIVQSYNHVDLPDYFKKGIKNTELTDTECLTFAMYGEARSEGDTGLLAVAYVIQNRRLKWGKNYCEVIRMKGEFSFYVPKIKTDNEKEQWWHILNISYFLINDGGYAKVDSPISNALYFNSLDETQQCLIKRRFVKKIGHHYFYR